MAIDDSPAACYFNFLEPITGAILASVLMGDVTVDPLTFGAVGWW